MLSETSMFTRDWKGMEVSREYEICFICLLLEKSFSRWGDPSENFIFEGWSLGFRFTDLVWQELQLLMQNDKNFVVFFD